MTAGFAIIGAGKWGANIVKTISASESMRLVAAITSKSRSEIEEIAPFDGVIFRDHEQIKNLKRKIDGVIIATPPKGREHIVEYFLNSGIPVFSEKPLTLDARQTIRLVDKARCSGVPLVEDFIHLYSWPYINLRKSISDRVPIEVESFGGNTGPYRDYSPIFDWGPHELSMALQLFGCTPQVDSVEAFDKESDYRFSCTVKLNFGKRGKATLTFGNTFQSKQRSFRCQSDGREWMYDDTASQKLLVDGSPYTGDEATEGTSALLMALECFAGTHSLYSREECYWLSESVASLTEEIASRV